MTKCVFDSKPTVRRAAVLALRSLIAVKRRQASDDDASCHDNGGRSSPEVDATSGELDDEGDDEGDNGAADGAEESVGSGAGGDVMDSSILGGGGGGGDAMEITKSRNEADSEPEEGQLTIVSDDILSQSSSSSQESDDDDNEEITPNMVK